MHATEFREQIFLLSKRHSQNKRRHVWNGYRNDQLVKPLSKNIEIDIVSQSSFYVLLNCIVCST